MFRLPKIEPFALVLSTRVRKPMAREARKRNLRVSDEVRRRLEFYAAHAEAAKAETATTINAE
jgi:hypothetical protein